jgi:hypothetical protein
MLCLECRKSSGHYEQSVFFPSVAHFGTVSGLATGSEIIDTVRRRMLILMVLQPSLFSQV